MSIYKLPEAFTYTAPAAADLSASLNRFVKIDTNGNAAIPNSGDKCIGTVFEAATATNPVSIQTGGIAKVVCGGTIPAGSEVQSDGAGAAIVLAAGKVTGVALVAGAAGKVIPVRLQ